MNWECLRLETENSQSSSNTTLYWNSPCDTLSDLNDQPCEFYDANGLV